jgi:hypothetical protein
VLLASHQLTAPTAAWWDAYVEAHEEPDTINWNEFMMAFQSYHVPQGVIKLKEFQDLKQGSLTISSLAYALEAYDFENFQTMVD